MNEPTAAGSELLDLALTLGLSGLLGALVWATWRLTSARTRGRRHQQGVLQ
jgi:hypothetical protein